jgi:geranylgeranyl diphosphate synthase type II
LSLLDWSQSAREQIDSRLSALIARELLPGSLHAAVEYSLLAGGKRLRPMLVLMAAEACAGRVDDAMAAACAIEMIHTYSLIHDDLPSMDDDDFRRGRPTSHKVFGEALAILAGDCLLTLAFETLARSSLPPAIVAEQTLILSRAAGGAGMVGGQVLDLEAERGAFTSGIPANAGIQRVPDERTLDSRLRGNDENRSNDPPTETQPAASAVSLNTTGRIPSNLSGETRVEQLTRIHRMKTGALITAALELGAVSASATPDQRQRLKLYGQCIGLAFQIADDLLDVTGHADRIGKTPGRDADLGKLTYPALLGLQGSRDRALQLVQDACDAVSPFGERGTRLKELAGFIVERDH